MSDEEDEELNWSVNYKQIDFLQYTSRFVEFVVACTVDSRSPNRQKMIDARKQSLSRWFSRNAIESNIAIVRENALDNLFLEIDRHAQMAESNTISDGDVGRLFGSPDTRGIRTVLYYPSVKTEKDIEAEFGKTKIKSLAILSKVDIFSEIYLLSYKDALTCKIKSVQIRPSKKRSGWTTVVEKNLFVSFQQLLVSRGLGGDKFTRSADQFRANDLLVQMFAYTSDPETELPDLLKQFYKYVITVTMDVVNTSRFLNQKDGEECRKLLVKHTIFAVRFYCTSKMVGNYEEAKKIHEQLIRCTLDVVECFEKQKLLNE